MSASRAPAQPFRREVMHFVFGGLAFVLFLAIASLVGLRASTSWALRQHEEKIAAQSLALAARVAEGPGPGHALGADARAIEDLRQFGVLQAAVFDGRGGGRPEMAQARGTRRDRLPSALTAIREQLEQVLGDTNGSSTAGSGAA